MSSKGPMTAVDVLGDSESQDALLSMLSETGTAAASVPKKRVAQPVQVLPEEDPEDEEPAEADAEGEPESGTDDDPEPDDEADADPEDGDTKSEEEVYDVQVDGETVQVTFDELTRGYSRTADYTRKTQRLAEDRRTTETQAAEAAAERTAAREARERYATQLERLEKFLKQNEPQKPDPVLRRENPSEYAAQLAEYNDAQENARRVQAEREATTTAEREERQRQTEQVVAVERERLHKAIPEWSDEKVRKAEQRALVEYVTQTYGYTPADLANTADHRLFVILRKAMKFDAIMKKTPKPKPAAKSPTLGPGRGQARQPKTKRDVLRKQFDRSGSVTDGAAILEAALE